MEILFIEDDTIETMKLHRALSKLEVNHSVREVRNGEEALEVLQSKEVLPEIILLDLNMPRMNGIEFLQVVKNDAKLKCIPIMILTTSEYYKDMVDCYNFGVAGYIIKPLQYSEYVEKIKRILDYWEINEFVKI